MFLKNQLLAYVVSCALCIPGANAIEKGVMSEEEVKVFLSKHTSVVAGWDGELKLDISQVKPGFAMSLSDVMLKHGLPYFLMETLKQYTKEGHILQTAKYMADIFSKGKVHVPMGNALTRKNLVANVNEIYTLILNHFQWKDGHPTEQTEDEVAAYLVTKARLENLKSLWVAQ